MCVCIPSLEGACAHQRDPLWYRLPEVRRERDNLGLGATVSYPGSHPLLWVLGTGACSPASCRVGHSCWRRRGGDESRGCRQAEYGGGDPDQELKQRNQRCPLPL